MTPTPTPTTEPTTALANREFTDQQIRTRLDAAAKPGFGLDRASRDQLNMIYLLAKHYDVDPAIDITLFQGRPFFTIDGRVRLMKRHPQYLGYRTRPLTKDEREAWGYKPEEIVVECTIRTRDWGEIVARGKVTPDEFGRQPVAKSHPQEMAEKRAIARASRLAFGQDVPDEDEVGRLVYEQQHPDPARVALNAAKHDQIFGADEDHAYAELPRGNGHPEPEHESQEPQPPSRSDLWTENRRLVERARELGLTVGPTLSNRSGEDAIAQANADLAERIQNAELDRKLGAEVEQEAKTLL